MIYYPLLDISLVGKNNILNQFFSLLLYLNALLTLPSKVHERCCILSYFYQMLQNNDIEHFHPNGSVNNAFNYDSKLMNMFSLSEIEQVSK